jgi:hypothetical protein
MLSMKSVIRLVKSEIKAKIATRDLMRRFHGRHMEDVAGYDWTRINHNRIEIINRAVCVFGGDQCRYLEIGCERNVCFDSVISLHKVGVDPARGGTIRATSDDFFSRNTDVFDVIFIDGLHTYEQVRRDAENGFKCLRLGGLMFFHDMLPNSWLEEAPVPIVGAWTGDVWKLALDLAATPGVAYRTIVADYGVGVVRKNTPVVALPATLPQPDLRNFADFLASRTRMNLIDFDQYISFLEDSVATA